MKNPFTQPKKQPTAPEKKTATGQSDSVDTIAQKSYSKKEKLQIETETRKHLEGLQSGQEKFAEDLKKMRESTDRTLQGYQETLDGLVEENEKQSNLIEELSRKQTEQGFAMGKQATIQEAMERSDTMYRQLLAVSRGLVESSIKNGSNVAELSEKMLLSLEETRKHLDVLVRIKTDIHLRSEDVERIAEPVSAALKSYVDSSLKTFNSETKRTLETKLDQTFSGYTQTLEDLVQRQEAAADRAEEAAEEVRQGLAAQEAARGWQNQAIATLGAIGLQAATVILGALVILGPIAAAFGLTDAPGYMQWLLDFGGRGIGHGVLAVLLTGIFVSVVAVLIVAGYYLLDEALQGRVGIRSLHDLWDYAKRVRARGSGEDQEPNVGS